VGRGRVFFLGGGSLECWIAFLMPSTREKLRISCKNRGSLGWVRNSLPGDLFSSAVDRVATSGRAEMLMDIVCTLLED
jgi:hypothetical protein